MLQTVVYLPDMLYKVPGHYNEVRPTSLNDKLLLQTSKHSPASTGLLKITVGGFNNLSHMIHKA
jgi:hypothetical protein